MWSARSHHVELKYPPGEVLGKTSILKLKALENAKFLRAFVAEGVGFEPT